MPEPDAIRVDLGQDRSIKAGDTVVLRASLNFQPALIRWSPSAETQGNTGLVLNVRPATTTTYQIEAQDSSGCKAIDEVLVRVSRTLHVYAPSAFSPNGDGNNDVFRLYPGPEVSAIRTMRIYNRWGVQVFEGAGDGSQAIPAWDGNIGSQPASTGAYLFVAELLFLDGHTDQIRGEFILLR
jgi:gliding motility-associated-like protein